MENISVVVPAYNVERYINRCIESVIKQSFSAFQLYLVDDGAIDHSAQYCDEAAVNDDRVVVVHQKNAGLSAARNSGIALSLLDNKIRWISFIDSDDWVNKEYLLSLYNGVHDSCVSISICNYERKKTFGEIDITDNLSQVITPQNLWVNHHDQAVIACGKLFEKGLFYDIRFPVGKIHEDEFTTYKLLFKSNAVVYMETKLYYYFVNDDGITCGKWSAQRLNALEAFKEQVDFFYRSNQRESMLVSLKAYIYWLCYYQKSEIKWVRKYCSNEKKELRHFLKIKGIVLKANENGYDDWRQLMHPLLSRLYRK